MVKPLDNDEIDERKSGNPMFIKHFNPLQKPTGV